MFKRSKSTRYRIEFKRKYVYYKFSSKSIEDEVWDDREQKQRWALRPQNQSMNVLLRIYNKTLPMKLKESECLIP